MRTVSVRLPILLDKQLRRLAKDRKLSRSALMREAVETLINGKRQSVAALTRDLLGIVKDRVPRDLSTNPKYLAGFGK
jgi:predicted transcriptional regulator